MAQRAWDPAAAGSCYPQIHRTDRSRQTRAHFRRRLDGTRLHFVPLTWADLKKSTALLGYHPATRLEEGLERFVAWYRSADAGRRA
jgi:nucleoside-diphosphate-sugar epimerase